METEMKNIMRKFFTSESEVFTGFHATYSRGNFYSTEGVPLSKMHIAWAEKEPNNVGNNENCITLNVNGEMADRSCDEPRPYICFRSADMKTEVNKCGTIDPGGHDFILFILFSCIVDALYNIGRVRITP
ncbi:hypothetical protein HF086_011858 [Spodoptera exigua]|uniref:C-type lectin domain-containing protein n=1 Tax=Spodoptera exigua TaxID=7107 RepID=A0A922SPK5_SPOEX|nr:hypothetical protein HF086_011858 [Spodoptera exigua]